MTSKLEEPIAELMTAEQVGLHVLGVSRRTVLDYSRAGLIPAPLKFAGRTLWRYRELIDWCAAGCPTRADWRWLSDEEAKPLTLRQAIDLAGGAKALGQIIDEAADELDETEIEQLVAQLGSVDTAAEGIQAITNRFTTGFQMEAD
jgi:hypothetical protein